MSNEALSLAAPFSSTDTRERGARALPMLLGTLILLATGCVSTHQVSPDAASGYNRVTGAAAGETARVHLRDGRKLKLNRLYVDVDSTTGITPQGRERAFSTSVVRKVQIVNRGAGALWGAGIGGATPPLIGLLRGISMESDGPNDFDPLASVLIGGLLALPGALVGAVAGGIVGEREIYRFSHVSPGADSAKAALRPRLPETRRRAAEQPSTRRPDGLKDRP